MNFYISLFANSEIIELHRWGEDGPGKEGTIMQAKFELKGQKFMCSDSSPVHNWDFTAVSNYIEYRDEKEIQRLFLQTVRRWRNSDAFVTTASASNSEGS